MRLLLAEDHNLMREGLRSLLEKEPDLQVVGEADTGRMAVRLANELEPDIVLMDVTMPDLSGIEATRQIKEHAPGCKVLALSVHCDGDLIAEALKAGASGYVLKICAASDLVQAIRAVAAGQTYLSPQVAGIVANGYLGRLSGDGPAAKTSLTPRQREVLQLLAEGLSSKQIALRLGRSIKTVEMHRLHLMEKLGIHSIAELTKYAVRKGLVSLDS